MNRWAPMVLAAAMVVSIGAHAEHRVGVERLPIDGMKRIVQEDGAVIYLSTNRRFAFQGTMYDLWRGEALELGVAVSQRLDLERNGVSIQRIGMRLGNDWSDSTLFIAPECNDCKELLRAAINLLDGDMNVVMLASSVEGRRANSDVWCARNQKRALKTVYLEGGSLDPDMVSEGCDRFGLLLAEEAAMLFGIGQLPLFLASDGMGYVGIDAIRAVIDRGQSRTGSAGVGDDG